MTAALDDPDLRTRLVVAYLAVAMVAGGHPVNEVEDGARAIAARLGHPRAQIGATPTGVTVSLDSGEPACFEAVEGSLRLDQSVVVDEIRRGVETGELAPADALERLASLRSLPPVIPPWVRLPANMMIAAGIAMVLQPRVTNVAVAALLGLPVALLARLAARHRVLGTVLPSVVAFLVALVVFLLAQRGVVVGPLRAVLPPIAILLPGALLVTGMAELAAGHMMAGTSRLVFGSVQLLLYTVGIVAAARLIDIPADVLADDRLTRSLWWAVPGLLLVGIGIFLSESMPIRLFGWVLGVLLVTFAAQVALQDLAHSAPLGGLLGGIVAAFGAGAISATRPRLPRLVVFLPSFWLLVPGSLGLLGVTGIGLRGDSPVAALMGVVATICGIALGVLIGSALAEPILRRLARRPLREL